MTSELKENSLAALFDRVRTALPATTGYELGFKDALESMVLALKDRSEPGVINELITTALDAFGNNADDSDVVAIDVNTYDGNDIVDSNTLTIPRADVSAIVDHAAEVILILRVGGGDHQTAMSNLEEALVAAEVIAKDDDEFEVPSTSAAKG